MPGGENASEVGIFQKIFDNRLTTADKKTASVHTKNSGLFQ
jgi:hypothetical protein